MKQEMTGWQRHQLDHKQIICTSLKKDNHASTSSLNFLQAGCTSWCPIINAGLSTLVSEASMTWILLNKLLLLIHSLLQGGNVNQQSTAKTAHTSYMRISLCTTVVHNTAQNNSDNRSYYPPDNHHCSDVVHWMTGTEWTKTELCIDEEYYR